MELACKKQWYKDKNDGCKLKRYFCLFLFHMLVIIYGCLNYFFIIINY